MSLYIVGFGSGHEKHMTAEARAALDRAEVIVGYTAYIKLLKPYFTGKTWIETGMTGEKDRCVRAIETAAKGYEVAVVSSGDAGIYGMAGLIYELCRDMEKNNGDIKNIDIEVIAGVTAASSGGAVLGAPLMHDFAVISLSDLMISYELIMKRIRAAASADFVICLYNPSSKKRKDYLKNACDIILEYKSPYTVCGVAVNIGRDGEYSRILSLSELRDYEADMFTTVFIGNESTEVINGRMVTKRGYKI